MHETPKSFQCRHIRTSGRRWATIPPSQVGGPKATEVPFAPLGEIALQEVEGLSETDAGLLVALRGLRLEMRTFAPDLLSPPADDTPQPNLCSDSNSVTPSQRPSLADRSVCLAQSVLESRRKVH
jgi:hypothetical protein